MTANIKLYVENKVPFLTIGLFTSVTFHWSSFGPNNFSPKILSNKDPPGCWSGVNGGFSGNNVNV